MDNLKLLGLLEKNADFEVCDLASVLNAEESEVSKELLKLIDEKIILGKHTVINWSKTNCHKVLAFIEVGVIPERDSGYDKIASRVYKYEEVTDCYLLSGNTELIVIVEGKTMQEVANFVAMKLAPIEGIKSTATHFVLKTYKHNSIAFQEKSEKQERVELS